MGTLLQVGLTNAGLAMIIALLALLVGRWKQNPRLEAALWLVVLVKLVTPPVLPYRLEVPTAAAEVGSPIAAAPTRTTPDRDEEVLAPTARPPERTASLQPDAGETTALKPTPSSAAVAMATPQSPPEERAFSVPAVGQTLSRRGIDMAGWIWIGGAVVAAGAMMANAYRFNRTIAAASHRQDDREFQSDFRRLCNQMGIRSRPRLVVIDAEISPLIWTWLGRTSVLYPTALMTRLTREQQKLVLAHELAHVRRLDHLVRWFESLVQSLYWWFLPVGWIRQRLHAAQECCCDEWVAARFADRRVEYCETLLAAANWLANVRSSPIMASEFGRSPSLKHRVQNLLQRGLSPPLSTRARVLWALIAMIFVTGSVRWVTADTPRATPSSGATGPTIEITVTDQQGRPIESGEAKIRGTTQMGDYFSATAPIQQGRGGLPLKSSRINEMTLELESPGYVTFIKKYIRSPQEPFLSAVTPEYRFRLKSGIKIGGRILDTAGHPIAKAKIHAYSGVEQPVDQGIDVFEQTVSTDPDGRWEMSGVPSDFGRLYLSVEHNAYRPVPSTTIVSGEDRARLKALADVRRLAAAPTLSGRVVDPTGKPVVGAMILRSDRDNLYREYDRGLVPKTDSSGRFHLQGMASGNQVLTVFSPNWALKTVKVSIPRSSPLEISVQKGKRVEIRAVNAKGEPIPGVEFHPQVPREKLTGPDENLLRYTRLLSFLADRNLIERRSDERGIFVWENAPDETLEYQILSPGILSQPGGRFGPAGSPYTLTFRSTIPVNAQVVDAETGEPISAYRIYDGLAFKANPPGMWMWNLRWPSIARPGHFEDALRTLDRVVQYRIQAEGYRPAVSEVFDAAKLPDSPISIVFRLQKDRGYRGMILTPLGTPAIGAKLYAKIKRRRQYESLEVVNGVVDESKMTAVATADGAGRVALARIIDPFVCLISHDSGYAQLMDVDLFKQTEVKLIPWGRIEGQLRIHGQPATRIAIQLNQRSRVDMESEMPTVSQHQSIVTDSSGRYRFDRCTAGQWDESIVYDARREQSSPAYQHQLSLDLAPGETLKQQIGANGTDLKGRIVLPKGADVHFSSVFLVQWDWHPQNDQTATQHANNRFAHSSHFVKMNPDGAFRFFNVEPGELQLTATVVLMGLNSPGPPYSKQITITRDMFHGKTPQDAIDLGEIAFDTPSP